MATCYIPLVADLRFFNKLRLKVDKFKSFVAKTPMK